MASRTVIDGNAFYEMDEECIRRREEKERSAERQRAGQDVYGRDAVSDRTKMTDPEL